MDMFSPHDPRPIHFVGIAGAGMSALAQVARRRGVAVSGCDLRPDGAPDLAALGIQVAKGHSPAHLHDARALIVSSAVPSDHAEVRAARKQGLSIVRRAEALAALVQASQTVAVAGTHGKTTTTVMTTEALVAAGRDPTGIAGGRVASWAGNARIGAFELFVVEADEYDRSFLALWPSVAVVTNVEADHLECYEGSLTALEDAFYTFAARAERVVVGVDGEGGRRLAGRLGDRAWRVGTGVESHAEIRVLEVVRDEGGSRAVIDVLGTRMTVSLTVPGMHVVRNAAAALGAVAAVGADLEEAAAGLAAFRGVGRRFERVGTAGGVDVVDDYAHHPTEVRAALDAARQAFPGRRLVAAFQPHLFSRTEQMANELGAALAAADVSVVTAVYAAREQPIAGVTGEGVAIAAREAGGVAEFVPDRGALAGVLAEAVRPGDVLLVLGAGDITTVAREVLGRLGNAPAAA
jgi:UDP-N-acetylmuramate--alanine ligase